MLNNPFVIQQSRAMVERINRVCTTDKDKVTMAFNLVYSRNPSTTERVETEKFLEKVTNNADKDEGLRAVCQSLFASAEFRFVD